MNLKWPKTPDNDELPWYIVLWWGFWFVPVMLSLFLSMGLIFIAAGKEKAMRFYDEVIY